MSHGPGSLQRAILHFVGASDSVPTAESMRWALYEQVKGAPVPVSGKLPTAWNTSFGRAMEGLASPQRPRLVVMPRRLASLQECVEHYPGKSLIASIRHLRLHLLPAINELVASEKQAPQYSDADNEAYEVKRLPRSERERLRREWRNVATGLKAAFNTADDDDTLFCLMAKGKSLFEDSTVSERRPFLELCGACINSGVLSADAAASLRHFADSFLPPLTAGSLRLKSYIHRFARLHSTGRYSLKPETIEDLHRLRREFVESLPGFKPSRSPRRGLIPPTHSHVLHKLFDLTVFQDFHFVRLAG